MASKGGDLEDSKRSVQRFQHGNNYRVTVIVRQSDSFKFHAHVQIDADSLSQSKVLLSLNVSSHSKAVKGSPSCNRKDWKALTAMIHCMTYNECSQPLSHRK